ncbi:SAM-dependent methyltransferase [Echinimonas agarilytica]|uniref:Cyclopropane-fatty-acyl-phospholipid synthase family protein n=1 Tax=Echinimonas agarilytica TaxID=1215918 RepID=A0AA41W7U6_9GAMM|nr:cyclopropane-fatty-acyl-phospholipid synthase family protein [Echinimonas agarilytica]MCM2679998.1 cyclopropane-fatty-acyl-phospholipid synthase family protein [Echinimonas agarilytica]
MSNESSLTLTSNIQASGPSVVTRMLLNSLQNLSVGQLTLVDGDRKQIFGEGNEGVSAHVTVHDPSFYKAVIKDGSIGAAESYMQGHWETPDLTAVMRLMASNLATLDRLDASTSWLNRLSRKLFHKLNGNSVTGSKKNIVAHYDLSNAFYELFLDSTMMYSAGVYADQGSTLQDASEHKLKRLCDFLDLSADDHLLEIGTGWGGLACYAAKHYGCKVTTTTISDEQYKFAQTRFEQEGVADQVVLLNQDYRALTGVYDKLISIEMIEAVGFEHLDQFFKKCSSLLKPGGKMSLQSITIADQREKAYRNSVDFIQRYIFPGGYLPSVAVLSEHIAKYSDLSIRTLNDIGLDYAKTLEDWRHNFEEQLDKVRALGFDEQFIRMWRFYLCYCEGGFREKTISTVQMQLEKAPYS